MQKGFSFVIILIAVVILAGLAYGGYSYFNLQKIKNINSFEECGKYYPVMESYPAQCNTPDSRHFVQELSEEEKKKLIPPSDEDTSNWKTYTDTRYQFSIKYPAEWILCEDDVREDETPSKLYKVVDIDSETTCDLYEGQAGLVDFSIYIYDKTDSLAKDYINQTEINSPKINFAGTIAYKSNDGQQIELVKGNYFYSINLTKTYNSNPSNVEILERMLSTFKFLK